MPRSEAELKALSSQEDARRLSKEQVLTARIVEKPVFLQSLDGEVVLRSLSHAKRQEFRERAKFGTPEYDDDLFTDLAIVYSFVDPELTEGDIQKFREQDTQVYDEIVLEVTKLNMLGRGEELGKDSSKTQN